MTRHNDGGVHVASERYALAAVDVIVNQRLSISARLLYAVLKTFANVTDRGADNPVGTSFVSKRRLAEAMGREGKPVTVRSIENWLAELERCGYVKVLREKRPGKNGEVNVPNRYYLNDGLTHRPRWRSTHPEPLAEDWTPDPKMIAYAEKHGCADIAALADQFRDIHLAYGTERVAWGQVWRAHVRHELRLAS